tara:strand:+ start:821 stop:961 length:141 start_codon:yes stop_codon:yes gene_type:complete
MKNPHNPHNDPVAFLCWCLELDPQAEAATPVEDLELELDALENLDG